MSNRTRRQFLEDSMFATAAAVAAGSSSELFAKENEADSQSSSPNERLNVAVIGVRGRGGSHIGAFAGRKDTRITYICDADRDVGARRATEVAKRQGGHAPTFVEDIRRVLEDKSVDIVSIATPNHWHALGAIWAIQAGKDVYVEKPVSHNVSEGRRIVEAARKYGRICQTGTQSRSNPGMQKTVAFVRRGELGRLKVARGLCYKPRGSIGDRGNYDVPSSVNYDLWLGPAPMAALTRKQFHYDWHWQWPYGNGDLGNQGIHQMDLARWAMDVDTLPNSTISYGGRFGYIDAGDTANTQVIMHDYGDKSLVFEVRGLKTAPHKGAKVGVIYECEEGYVVVASYGAGTVFDLKGKEIKSFTGTGNHFENFLHAVRSRKIGDLNADIHEGHLSSAMCHLGNISYRLGSQMDASSAADAVAQAKNTNDNVSETLERTLAHLKDNKVDLKQIKLTVGQHLKIDTKTESFIDNPSADAMLTRKYRKPFVVPAAANV